MGLFSRREILVGMGAAGLSPLIVSMGCGSDGGASSLPELPEYEWNSALGPESVFEHGVASGDPQAEAVIIWTRISSETAPAEPPESDDPLSVWWEVALDEAFERRVKQGTFRASPDSDFTVKVDVSGLVWGRNYYYRFFAQGRQSPIGRTRLLPAGNQAQQLRFAVCVCSSYARGWFHAYRHIAARADLDAVVHLGDYIYEYGDGDLSEVRFPVYRNVEPPHETVSLEDYRLRYSQYRRDSDCQECHRQHPFIVVWDDHESANNSWMGGAENHDPDKEGPWEQRLASARQAFFEWIPIRDNPTRSVFRSFQYGDLADLVMLDTRIEGREEQVGGASCDLSKQEQPNQILGAAQEEWLFEELSRSAARWRIIGNQVVIGLWQLEDPNKFYNSDQWNCYPAARARLLNYLRDQGIGNVVFATGDVHSSWAMDVTVGDGSYDPESREGAVAVEFVTPGITASNPFFPEVQEGEVLPYSPHVRYTELYRKGYLVLDVQQDKVQSDWYLLDGVNEGEGNESLDASWAVMDGEKQLVEMSGAELPPLNPPPLAS